MTFVDLDRTFFLWTEDRSPVVDPELLSGLNSSIHWSELIKFPRVVVLAEAGSGKSDELKGQAAALQKAGHIAFYATVQNVANFGLPQALRADGKTQFSEWRTTGAKAWFFIDSIDEAKLDGISLETALRRIADAIEGLATEVTIVLSGRITDWEFRADLARFDEFLPVPVNRPPVSPEAPQEALVRILNQEHRREKDEARPQPRVYLMTQLDNTRIKTFAANKGVQNVDDFINAIAKADLWSLAGRPADLIWLVDYWSRSARFGSYAQMLETSITERLREIDPQRAGADELAPERAAAALERIGAALIFGRRSEISVPDCTFALRPAESQKFELPMILPDFKPSECQQLLRLAVFDAATFGCVRLHNDNQGVMRSYLAARWIKKRLDGNCPRSAIYELLFAQTYGKQLVRPSVHQTVAWLSIWDADVAKEVIDRDPQLLLSAGDPSSLSAITREEVLSRVIAAMVTSGYRFTQYPREGLKRLAQPDMQSVVRHLWNQHGQNEEVRHLLLLLIEQGQLSECSDIAKEAVWGKCPDRYTQIFAGRALLASASTELLDEYADLVMTTASNMRGIAVMDALEQLFPRRISVHGLLSILRQLSPQQRDESYGMQIHGPRFVAILTQRDHIATLLSGLLELVGSRPAYPNYEETAEEKAYQPAIEQACSQLLTAFEGEQVPNVIFEAVLRLGADYRRNRVSKTLQQILNRLQAFPTRRRLLLWRAVETVAGNPMITKGPPRSLYQVEVLTWPAGLVHQDLEWLIDDIATRPTDSERSIAVDAAMRVWQENGQVASELDRIKSAASRYPELLSLVEAILVPPAHSPEIQRLLDENEALKQEHAERQAERDQSWREFVDQLKKDPRQLLALPTPTRERIDRRLFGLWQLLNAETSSTNRYAVEDISFLEPALGPELTHAFQTALISFWRKWKPTLESEREPGKRNMINSVDCMGLAGVSLEAKNKSSWAAQLNAEDAVRAAQYATIELNGFPAWFASLALAWPQQVGEVLMQEIQSQLNDDSPEPYHGILDDLLQASSEISAAITPGLIKVLHTRTQLRTRYLSNALDIVTRHLTDKASRTAFTKFALARFRNATDDEEQALYLGAAFSSDATEATEALSERLNHIDAAAQANLGQRLLPRIFGNHGMSQGANAPQLPFEILERLVHIAYRTVRPSEDNNRASGVAYSSNSRDFAESARSAAFNQLYNTLGYKTFLALQSMASTPGFPIDSRHLSHLALSRALHDSERAEWPPQEAHELEQTFDLAPRTPADLRSLTMTRLAEIQHDLIHAEFAQGPTLKSLPDEREVQKWVASELKHRTGRAYSLEREPHVADEKEPDIRLHSMTTDARLPIEVKVAESWSLKQLETALVTQLCQRYMRERSDSHGILLIVHQTARRHGWKDDAGRMLTFAEVITRLRQLASNIAGSRHKAPQPAIAILDVSGVSLKREKAAKRTAGRKSPGRKRSNANRSAHRTGQPKKPGPRTKKIKKTMGPKTRRKK